MEADPVHRREVEVARSLGISHRRFLGWEPVTRYRYDDHGRVTDSWREPEWSPPEREKMLALAFWDAVYRCPVCGGPKAECQSPESEKKLNMFGPPVRCHRKTGILRETEKWREDKRQYPEALIPQPNAG